MTDSWLKALQRACESSSQRRVSDRLRLASGNGFPSETVISQVLSAKYPGRHERLRMLVENAYLGAVVECPVLDTIPREDCSGHQRKPFAATNPVAVRLFRACRNCQHKRRD